MILVGLICPAQIASAQTQFGADSAAESALVVAPMQSNAALKDYAETLTELIRVEVGKSDRFMLVTPEEIGAIDAEIKRQLEGGCDESTCIAELGGAVGARYLITSRLKRVQSRYIVVLKLIDIERVAAVDTESLQEVGKVALIDRMGPAVTRWLRGDSSAQTTADEEDKQEELAIPVIPQGIVITGSRTQRRVGDATVATEVISRRDIIASGAETLADLLEEHPGADVSRSFRGAGLRLQGLDEKHVLILMDGERTGGRIGGALDLSRVPVSTIERVELVKGPSSALYGSDAMGGVVNVITRGTRRARELEGKATLGTYGMVDLSGRFGFKDKNRNTRTFVGWHRIDAYDLQPEDEATTGSAYSMGHVSSRNAYRFNDLLTLISRLGYLQRDQKGVDANNAGAVFDRRNLTENAQISLEPRFRFGDAHLLKFVGSYRYFRDQYVYDQRLSSEQDQDQETREQLAQLSVQYNRKVNAKHRFIVGSDLFFEELKTVRLLKGEGTRYRGALFLQDEWSPRSSTTSMLRLVPGYRFDFDSDFGLQQTPKFALRYDPSKRLKLRASYGKGFRAPDFKELLLIFENPSAGYVVEGNPDLKAETSNSGNMSAEIMLGASVWWFANVFHNEIARLINTERVDDPNAAGTQRYSYVNVDAAFTQGVETRARWRWSRSLILESGYTLTNARNRTLARELSGRARHRATFDLRYRYRPWALRLTTRGSWVGRRPFYESDGLRYADPYVRMGLRASKKWGKNTTFFAGVENLLNEGDPNYLPIQPRTLSAGVSGRL